MEWLNCFSLVYECVLTDEARNVRAQEWIAAATSLAAFCSAASLVLLTFTVIFTRSAAKDARDTVKLTQESNDALERQIYPYLGVSRAYFRDDGKCFIHIKNFGSTPALEVLAKTRSLIDGAQDATVRHEIGIVDPGHDIPAVVEVDVDKDAFREKGANAKLEVVISYTHRSKNKRWIRRAAYYHGPGLDKSDSEKELFLFPASAREDEIED